MPSTLTIDESLLAMRVKGGRNCRGKSCYLAWTPELDAFLSHRYARRGGLALKVFHDLQEGESPEAFQWSGNTLDEVTIVQNVFALHGITPFVYDVALCNGKRLVQVTRLADERGSPDVIALEALRDRLGIKTYVPPVENNLKFDMEFDVNWVGGQFVDFGGWYFSDPAAYESDLVDRLVQFAKDRGQFTEQVSKARHVRASWEIANWMGYWGLLP